MPKPQHFEKLTRSPSPRKLNSRVPKDLETICLKCLEKAPDRRCQTADELRENLRRFLGGEPVHARPITKLARGWRWCKRNPWKATVAVFFLFLGVAGPLAFLREASLRQVADRATLAAIKQEKLVERATIAVMDQKKLLEWQLYLNRVHLAHRECLANNIALAEDTLGNCPVRAPRLGVVLLQAIVSPRPDKHSPSGAGQRWTIL